MNVLQILPALEVGGVERGTVDFARYLTLNGHKAIVISRGGKLVKRLDEVGARHYALPVGKKSPLGVAIMIKRVCDIIDKENVDIVHARSRVPAIIGFLAAKMSRKIFITTAHGYYNTHLPSRAMGWGRFVIVASNSIARHMIEDFGVPYERIRLIPRGVNLNEFDFHSKFDLTQDGVKPKARHYRIGVVSRITPLKGHVDFFKAVAIVARTIPTIKVSIIGEVPASKARYREELELLIRRLGIGNIVDFMGQREDIPDLLSSLDVLVLPTKTPEAFGRSIIEAQAVGVPVVASRIGGIVDIIRDGENGLLSLPGEPHSIAENILKILKDRQLAHRMVIQARKDVEERYSHLKMAENTLEVYKEAFNLKKILVIKLSAIGDVILSVPSLKVLRKKFPKAVIKVLVGLSSSDILRGCPYIDERIVYDPTIRDIRFKGLMKIAGQLRREDFDIVVDLQNNRKSHLLSFLSMAPLRYGYDNGKWSFLINKKAKDANPLIDPVDHQFRTLKLLGIDKSDEVLELWPSEADYNWADRFLSDNWVNLKKPLIGINVGASKKWQSKRWPNKGIISLCDNLAARYNIRVILTGGADDIESAQEINGLSKSRPIVAVGKTDILELAALISRCDVYITSDSAPMHIASSVGVSLVALFGPTDPRRHTVKSKKAKILTSGAKCSPCYKATCKRNFSCMRNISPEAVIDAVKDLLKRKELSGKKVQLVS